MRHSRLKIQTSSNKYSIYIGTNISDKIKTILNNEKIFFNKVLIIYDSKIKFKEVLKIKLKLKKKRYLFINLYQMKNLKSLILLIK